MQGGLRVRLLLQRKGDCATIHGARGALTTKDRQANKSVQLQQAVVAATRKQGFGAGKQLYSIYI
jgi:hypothetical protein